MRSIKKFIAIIIIKLLGWRIEGQIPRHVEKMVLLGVPHTSACDFYLMLLSAWYYKLKVKWVGKEKLFKPKLLGSISRFMGGICVERSTSTNSVHRIAQVLNSFPGKLCLVIAPNGSRKNTKGWRTGFYHIAQAANLPIALGFLDYGKKAMGVKHLLTPSGDIIKDLQIINQYYQDVKGKYADIMCPVQLMPKENQS